MRTGSTTIALAAAIVAACSAAPSTPGPAADGACRSLDGRWRIVTADSEHVPPSWQDGAFDVREGKDRATGGRTVSLYPLWDSSLDEAGQKPPLDAPPPVTTRSPFRIALAPAPDALVGALSFSVRRGAEHCALSRPASARCATDGSLELTVGLPEIDVARPCGEPRSAAATVARLRLARK